MRIRFINKLNEEEHKRTRPFKSISDKAVIEIGRFFEEFIKVKGIKRPFGLIKNDVESTFNKFVQMLLVLYLETKNLTLLATLK